MFSRAKHFSFNYNLTIFLMEIICEDGSHYMLQCVLRIIVKNAKDIFNFNL